MKKDKLIYLIASLIILLTLGSVMSFDWNDGKIVAYWKMDETSGIFVNDSVGGNGGTLINTPTSIVGKIGNAYRFDGVNEEVTVPDSPSFAWGTGNFTINFWVNMSVGNTLGGTMEKIATGAGNYSGWAIFTRATDNMITYIDNAGSALGTGNIKVDTSNWVMVTLKRDGTNVTTYINGTLDKIYTSSTNVTITDTLRFANIDTWGQYGKLELDEIGMWNRTLNQSEITELYNSGNGLALGSVSSPTTTLNSPSNNSQTITSLVTFNASVTPKISSLINATIYVWYSNLTIFNTTTKSLTGSVYNSTTWNINLSQTGSYIWNVKGCQGNGIGINCSFASNNFTLRYSLLTTNNMTYNPITYETEDEQFMVNITTNGLVPTSASLIYSSTITPATITNGGGNNYNISSKIDIPTGVTNNSFYFNFTLGGIEGTTDSFQQKVSNTTLTMKSAGCDTGSLTYLNFTFQDEANFTSLSAKNDLAEATYWLGSGSVTKSLITSNISANQFYDFCLTPQNRTLSADLTFKYSATSYPQRTFVYTNQSFTSSTTNKTLYLLSTSDGIYSSFSIVNTAGGPIQGATVIVERQFSGVWTTIGQDVTGSDGLATFWVNPNFQHRITVSKTGYISTQVTITPSQSLYTITISSVSGASTYNSQIPGILWTIRPSTGTIGSGTSTNFNVTVVSSEANLENCKLELMNASNLAVLATGTSAATNTSYCFVNVAYTPVLNQNFFGRLSVDTINTTGFVIVNADWKWIVIDIEQNRWRGIKSFFSDITTIGEFGEGNEGEFSRIVVFFLLTTIFIGILIYFTGIELNNPGVTIIILWFIALLASAGGFLTFESGSDNVSSIIKQWGFFFIFSIYAVNYFLTIIRRSQE